MILVGDLRSIYSVLIVVIVVFFLSMLPSSSASWTTDVKIVSSQLHPGELCNITIVMDNISRTPSDQPHWIHSFKIFLEGPNGSVSQIVDRRMDEIAPPEVVGNYTYVDTGCISNCWIVEANIPDIEPGEYNITIIIVSSQGSFDNESVSQSYESTLVIETASSEGLNVLDVLVAGAIVAIASVLIIQIWRNRHDWG